MRAIAKGWRALVTCPHTGERLYPDQVARLLVLTAMAVVVPPLFVVLLAAMMGGAS